ncbi:hypothetical protein BJX99DRAFT_231673 [Aspergillus californicus]
MKLPFPPAVLTPIASITQNSLPITSRLDLMAFKAFVCGMRSSTRKKEIDAQDVLRLMQSYANGGHLGHLNVTQADILMDSREDLENYRPNGNWQPNLP